jgi:hypothetical protein
MNEDNETPSERLERRLMDATDQTEIIAIMASALMAHLRVDEERERRIKDVIESV